MRIRKLMNKYKYLNCAVTKVETGRSRQYYFNGDFTEAELLHLLFFKVDLLYGFYFSQLQKFFDYGLDLKVKPFRHFSLYNKPDNFNFYVRLSLDSVPTINKYVTHQSIKRPNSVKLYEITHRVLNTYQEYDISRQLTNYIDVCNKSLLSCYRRIKAKQINNGAKNG